MFSIHELLPLHLQLLELLKRIWITLKVGFRLSRRLWFHDRVRHEHHHMDPFSRVVQAHLNMWADMNRKCFPLGTKQRGWLGLALQWRNRFIAVLVRITDSRGRSHMQSPVDVGLVQHLLRIYFPLLLVQPTVTVVQVRDDVAVDSLF